MSNIAVVTGVASGIGKEAAHDLVARDWTVFGLDIAQDGLDKTTTALASERFHPVVCDIRSAEAVQNKMAEIGNRTGKINALIASAGVIRLGALSEMSVEDFDLIFDVNVRGLWLSARETIPFLRAAAKDGELARIVMLSSVSALRPKIEGGAYGASKIAVSQLARVMGVECAKDGILVNAVAPGTVDTPMVQNADTSGNWRPSGPSPIGRVAEPKDIVRVIRFLLSEDSAYVTGTTIPVDGGTHAAFVPPK
jgi:2,3-dihydro-2,3-dihydroxybenzoate dehydrogenase